jgi:phenylpropionate dioxygenase-like ring-hydroxylating dioxygenase large terminal subunit
MTITGATSAAAISDAEGWAREDLWWPLALATDVENAGRIPVAVALLGVPWALAVLDGQFAALKDLCPHRRVPLSAGTVADGPDGQVLECGYHGWSYGRSGECAAIPALGEGRAPRGMGGTPILTTTVLAGLLWGASEPSTSAPNFDLDSSFEPIPLNSQAIAAPAHEVAQRLAGTTASPGGTLVVQDSDQSLCFAIRAETPTSSVIFPIVDSNSIAAGMQEWVRILDDLGSLSGHTA